MTAMSNFVIWNKGIKIHQSPLAWLSHGRDGTFYKMLLAGFCTALVILELRVGEVEGERGFTVADGPHRASCSSEDPVPG